MELPVNIIILLFIAIVVGVVVIQFAQEQIFEAKVDLNSIGEKEADRFVIEMASPDINQIAHLVEQCYRDNIQTTNGDSTCYVVQFASNADIDQTALENVVDPEIETLVESIINANAIFIKYNRLGRVEVTN